MVERRLKASGLVVDLKYDIAQPMTELLNSVARNGVLYAIVITSQHEVHRSVTVNILHGTPQGKECPWCLCVGVWGVLGGVFVQGKECPWCLCVGVCGVLGGVFVLHAFSTVMFTAFFCETFPAMLLMVLCVNLLCY